MKCMIYYENMNSEIGSKRERKPNKSVTADDKDQNSTSKNISPDNSVSIFYNFQNK